jgi:cytochrome c biogenesis protein CcmG/thiol:disulfide interchange protein DsbE
MKRFWFLIPLAAFLALAVMLAVGLKLDPREVPSPLIDKPAPKFALQRLDDAGKTIRLDDMRGKVWVLNVWASWCVACREEHPLLVEFAKKGRAALRPQLQGPARRRPGLARPLRQLLRRLVSTMTAMGIDFGVYGAGTFVIDQNGVIRLKHIGPITPDVPRPRSSRC